MIFRNAFGLEEVVREDIDAVTEGTQVARESIGILSEGVSDSAPHGCQCGAQHWRGGPVAA